MPAGLTVPTIFTAVDRLSSVVSRMGKAVSGFAGKAQAGVARVNSKFNSMIPGYNSVKGALMGYVGAAVGAAAIIGGLTFSAQSLVEYEKKVASLRLILNDLSTTQFDKYKKQIATVARSTRTSAVEIADSFARIAEINYDLAKTPQGLAAISKAAVIFARAADTEVAPAAESLVSIMSQFELPANQASRVMNTLAAGLKVGSANILDQVEAYKNYGPVAKGANLTIEQSTALLQVLGRYQLKGAEAGTALRATIIDLQKAGAGYTHGQFNMNDALAMATKKYNSLATARQKDAFLIEIFGKRQITAGRILLKNGEYINRLTREVTGTNEAYRQAEIRVDTVAGRWKQLTGVYETYITTSAAGNKGMNRLKGLLKYVADNFDDIIDKVITAVKWFAIIKGALWTATAALNFWNFGMKIGAAANWLWNTSALAVSLTVKAWPWILSLATDAMWVLGSTMTSVREIMAAWNITAAGVGKSFQWVAIIYAVVTAIKTLIENWETIKNSFASGNWMVGFSQAIRALIIVPLMELGSILNKILKFTGIDIGAHFPETSQDRSDYVATGTWGDNKPQPLITPTLTAQMSAGKQNDLSKSLGEVGITIFNPDNANIKATGKGDLIGGIKVSSTTGQN